MAAQGNEPRSALTPERWRRVGELFHQALEAAPRDWTAWVNHACPDDPLVCGEVLSLLGSDRAATQGFIEDRVKPAVVSLIEESDAPARVGPYRIERELGRGGMGTVYLAERDDEEYHTKVAIKLVRRGMDTALILHRFRRERQTLARLSHPHIARLLDGGTTPDGLPYIVMEFVNGVRITEYCRTQGLSVTARLKLFLDVCSAVEYAHRQFVVHRDLKPGNLLVDESGAVKLLDFGICKLLHSSPPETGDTMTGPARMLTPDYASPEQILGEPTTVASDVYSLGAVLYELLAGVKPHRIEQYTLRGIERGICETETVRPSLAAPDRAVGRRLEGDLDNILLCALQKDPQRRYLSVERFSEDLRNHLEHRPVNARPDSVTYRAGKFLRRRRGLVAAVAAVVVSLAAGLIVSAREARNAQENLRLVRRLSNTFVFDVHDAVRELPGSTRARQLIVQTGLQYLDNLARSAGGDPEMQSELAAAYRRIGDVQGNVMGANLGNTAGALASYRKALALLDTAAQRRPRDRAARIEQATLHHRVAGVHTFTRDAKQALAAYAEAERLTQALLTESPNDHAIGQQLASILTASGDLLRLSGDYRRALDTNTRALALLEGYSSRLSADAPFQSSLAAAYSAVGMCEVRLGRLKEGLERYKAGAARMEQVVRMDPANVRSQRGLMFAYAHMGDVLGAPNLPNLEQSAAARDAYGRMLDVARRMHEADPADQRAAGDYAIALARVAAVVPPNQLPERLALLRQSVKMQQEVARINPANRSNSSDLAFGQLLLGDALAASGDDAGAVRAYRDSLALAETLLGTGSGPGVVTLVLVCRRLGEAAARGRDRAAAISYARRALDMSDPAAAAAKNRTPDFQRFLTPRGWSTMGLVHAGLAGRATGAQRLRDAAQARHWLEKGLAEWRSVESHPAFAPIHRREMRDVEAALAALERSR